MTMTTSSLDQSRQYIDNLLSRLPDNEPEAHHILMQQLAIDPSPGLISCVMRLMQDEDLDHRFQAVPRKKLILTLLAEQQLAAILDSNRLDAAQIAHTAELLQEAVRLHQEVAAELTQVLESLSWDDHQTLTGIKTQLDLDTDRIAAALTIAPQLHQLASAVRDETVATVFPHLSAKDAGLLKDAANSTDISATITNRLHINAVALHSLLTTHLEEWQARLNSRSASDPIDGALRQCYTQLEHDKRAYDYIAAQIQEHHDNAMLDRRAKSTDALREVKGNLFKINLRLAPILRAGFDKCVAETSSDEQSQTEQLWTDEEQQAAIAAGEAVTRGVDSSHAEREEALLHALMASSAEVQPGERLANQDRLRIKILATMIGALLLGAIGVNVVLWKSSPKPVVVSPTEFSNTITLEHISNLGSIMVSQIDPEWSWRDLSRSQRLEKLSTLAKQAANRGFETVILTDQDDTQLAFWTAHSGPNLLRDDR